VAQDAEWHSHHLFLAHEHHRQYLQAADRHQLFPTDLVQVDHHQRELILAYLHLWYHRKYIKHNLLKNIESNIIY